MSARDGIRSTAVARDHALSEPRSRSSRRGMLKAGPLYGGARATAICATSALTASRCSRAVSFIVRDENWGTYTPAIIETSRSSRRSDGFSRHLRRGLHREPAPADLRYRATIDGRRRRARSTFEAEGEAVDRLPDQPHRLRRAASARGRRRRARSRSSTSTARMVETTLPGADRSGPAVDGPARADA